MCFFEKLKHEVVYKFLKANIGHNIDITVFSIAVVRYRLYYLWL